RWITMLEAEAFEKAKASEIDECDLQLPRMEQPQRVSFVPTKHFMIFLVIQQFPNLRRHVLYSLLLSSK
ncbi:MAG: hypothetical protein ACJ708_08000, partial [Nitrososphaeraceae archaeon]